MLTAQRPGSSHIHTGSLLSTHKPQDVGCLHRGRVSPQRYSQTQNFILCSSHFLLTRPLRDRPRAWAQPTNPDLGDPGGGQTPQLCPQPDTITVFRMPSTLLFNHHFPITVPVPRSYPHGAHSLQESNGSKKNHWHTESLRGCAGSPRGCAGGLGQEKLSR